MAEETDKEMFERIWHEVNGHMQKPEVRKLIDEAMAAQRSLRAIKGKLFMLVGDKNGDSLWRALEGREPRIPDQ